MLPVTTFLSFQVLLLASDLNVYLLISLIDEVSCLLAAGRFLDLLSHLLFYCQMLWTFSFAAVDARVRSHHSTCL